VQVHGYAKDPSAVLAKLSTSPWLVDAKLEPTAELRNARLPAFMVTATTRRTPVDQVPAVLPASGPPREVLLERVRSVLDAHMAGKCVLISQEDRSDVIDVEHSVSVMARLRCGGSLEQLVLGLREIELGAPALALSHFVLYPQGAMEPIRVATVGPQIDLRITATGLLP
jgi:hypothetical protein